MSCHPRAEHPRPAGDPVGSGPAGFGTGCPPADVLARLAERGLEACTDPALEEHLAGCACCRQLLTAVVLERLPGEPPGLQVPESQGWLERWFFPVRLPRPVAVLASVALLVFGLSVAAAPFLWRALNDRSSAEEVPLPESPASSLHGPPRNLQPPVPGVPEVDVAPAPAPVVQPGTPTSRPMPGEEEIEEVLPPPPPAPAAAREEPAAPAPAPVAAGRREKAERLFVDAMVHYQSRRFGQATRTFDRLLESGPEEDLRRMALRWRARSMAEQRGECLPGYVQQIRVVPARPDRENGGGHQGPTQVIECVLPD